MPRFFVEVSQTLIVTCRIIDVRLRLRVTFRLPGGGTHPVNRTDAVNQFILVLLRLLQRMFELAKSRVAFFAASFASSFAMRFAEQGTLAGCGIG
ncbi:MAG: hypothetical protein LBE17_05550 [Treponema sp.]|nr:hypothetical protein [Treponema sp.]